MCQQLETYYGYGKAMNGTQRYRSTASRRFDSVSRCCCRPSELLLLLVRRNVFASNESSYFCHLSGEAPLILLL